MIGAANPAAIHFSDRFVLCHCEHPDGHGRQNMTHVCVCVSFRVLDLRIYEIWSEILIYTVYIYINIYIYHINTYKINIIYICVIITVSNRKLPGCGFQS